MAPECPAIAGCVQLAPPEFTHHFNLGQFHLIWIDTPPHSKLGRIDYGQVSSNSDSMTLISCGDPFREIHAIVEVNCLAAT
ncbi:hypothetical protein L915_08187 [Phytophthora nicotianae]|uniref:Uncharacterized protein n=1 Tax=Phytophthora nicotianae TaxID=4792 RepID=W2J591_PHYNI|nr:hypothetical protein L915_08187 [Phytophthora nicotianae]ETL40773.1 hypothetical protein L916_08110 [Phytophthora nicotianae]